MNGKKSSNGFFNEMKSTFSSTISKKEDDNVAEDSTTVKTKVYETFNNLRYELGGSTTLKKDTPLWLLGVCYHLPSDSNDFLKDLFQDAEKARKLEKSSSTPDALKLFISDFKSKFWFTYRKGYKRLNGSNLTSDTGWGCMLRSAQMMIAQGLVMHLLSRHWRWTPNHLNLTEAQVHRTIIKWFLDEPNRKCPFGLHTLVEFGENYQCKAGNWYGPATAAYIMQHACDLAKGDNSELNNLHIYVAQDCTVYTQDVEELFEPVNGAESSSVIILISVRLGAATINTDYIGTLQTLFTLGQSIGVIGGRPKHSLYFVGFQDDNLLYLDPHYCQPAHTLESFTNKCLGSYHNDAPRKIGAKKVDPSCCLGFYCRDKEDFSNFVTEVNRIMTTPAPSSSKNIYPIFQITQGRYIDVKLQQSSYEIEEIQDKDLSSPARSRHQTSKSTTNASSSSSTTSNKLFNFGSKKKLNPKLGSKNNDRSPSINSNQSFDDFEFI